ncbi:MAG: response regulator [Nitrospiria bacterium]
MDPNTLNSSILIVEDDPNTVSLLTACLEREGFKVIPAYDGEKAIGLAKQHNPVLVILDLLLPIVDGLEVCQRLRKISDVPILMLTGRGREDDKVLGLTIGADDYLVKPFSTKELVARVKALLRRSLPKKLGSDRKFSYRGLELDPERHHVTLKRHPVMLTPYEFRLLQTLMAAPGHVFSREKLMDQLYGLEGVSVVDRTIDVHIANLREKLEQDPSKPEYILTVRGFGYKFTETEHDHP